MLRGLYTGASGMIVQHHRMDAVSNNLANINTAAYKNDTPVLEAFPQLLMRRINTNITNLPPSGNWPLLGSIDKAPVIGTLGTGVALDEVYTIFDQGSLQETSNPFDLALEGEGFFVVQTPYGERLTRNGSFILGQEGQLLTKEGYQVLGENGPISIKLNNFMIDQNGNIFANNEYEDDPFRLVSSFENQWTETDLVDRLRIESVDRPRYLRKQGSSLYLADEFDSGTPFILEGEQRAVVRQGFIETSNVNPVTQMVKLIEINRAYEANQKVVQAQDQSADKLINQAMRF
jgi:flagellar basal-body rod protein FlgF